MTGKLTLTAHADASSRDLMPPLDSLATAQFDPGEHVGKAGHAPQAVEALQAGTIDGAWIPEPYASQAISKAGAHAHVLVDERDLWPNGRYVTTQLIVRTAFLQEHPDLVRALLEAQVEANDAVNVHAAAAQQVVARQLKAITGSDMDPQVLASAWRNLVFTNDPIASSLLTSAQRAHDNGNVVEAESSLLLDAGGNYLYAPGKFVAAVGVKDLVVVETEDALLVTTRERAQDVGKVVRYLDEKKRHKLV